MTDLLPPTWLAEDLPILVAAVELVDHEGTADFRRVAQVADLPEDVAKRALLRLDGEYLEVSIQDGWGGEMLHAVVKNALPAGRRAPGQWPSPEDMAREIAEALEAEQLVRRDEDALVRGIGGTVKDVTVGIVSAVLMRPMGPD
ncbi:hypothetical protein GCM10027030_00590 [Luteococcus sediminum]